jgi:hypothetical protein
MSTRAATLPAAMAGEPARVSAPAGRALAIGLIAILVTWLGVFVSGVHRVATSWLVGIAFWTAMALGALMLTMILHIFDANWATVIRRQIEHFLVSFKWIALLFVPLILISILGPHDAIWGWMDPHHLVMPENKTVAQDVIYWKKAALLNIKAFVIIFVGLFAFWSWLAGRLRRASIAQDSDGDARWTRQNRFTSGLGIPLSGLALTLAAIYWYKSLEYHWFSTMYGVWYFADCMRGILCLCVLMMLWLWRRGDFKGVIGRYHWHSIGQLMLTFTVFWGYIAFAQYFLIWNADVPEETFFYNEREWGDWWWIGMVLVFCNFLIPFLALLSYRYKVTHRTIQRIACWILTTTFIDLVWNILPAIKDPQGHAEPFLSLNLLWAVTATVGIGGVCLWAYFRAMATTRLIPIRDPRILECLGQDHDAH